MGDKRKMKSYFRDYAKEGELSYQVAQRFAKESTKEDFAKKIIEIMEGHTVANNSLKKDRHKFYVVYLNGD